MNREQQFRHANQRIQLIKEYRGWFVVHTQLVKSAGPFRTKAEAQKFKRKAINAELAMATS
jgi:hypothetical protein